MEVLRIRSCRMNVLNHLHEAVAPKMDCLTYIVPNAFRLKGLSDMRVVNIEIKILSFFKRESMGVECAR